MTAELLLPLFVNLVIFTPAPQQGEPVEAVFTKPSYDAVIDANPVQARAASYRPVPKIEASFPWVDRVQLTHPIILDETVESSKAEKTPDLSWEIIDSDPVASRGF